MQMSSEQRDGLKRVITFVALVLFAFASGLVAFTMMLASESY